MIRKSLLFGVALLAFALAGPPIRAQSGAVGNLTAASTNCLTTNSCLEVDIPPGMGSATIKMAGTMNVVAQFEVSADPLTVPVASAKWVAFIMNPSDGSAAATSATESGSSLSLVWQQNVGAYKRIRLRISTYTSGTVAGAINLSTASARSSGSGGSGSIGGTATAGQVAVGNGSNTLSSDSQFLWNLTNHAQFIGPQESTLPTEMQGWFATYPLASELVNSTQFNGVGILQSITGNAFWTAAFATTPGSTAAITGIASSDITSGTIPELIGVDGAISIIKGGTVTNVYGFLSDSLGTVANSTGGATNITSFAASPMVFLGTGTATNVFGFKATKQVAIGPSHVTNSYQFYGEDTGTGANDWAYYSNGGKSKFISGVSQTAPIMNYVSLPWTGTPYGAAVGVFGSGSGLDPADGTPSLLEIGQESSANTEALTIWNKTAPTGNSFYEYMDDTGLFALNHSSNGVEFDTDFFNADGSRSITLPAGKQYVVNNPISATAYTTVTNCSSSASPAVCSAAAAGSVVVAAAATSVVVNTSAVTANSQIFIQFDSSLSTKLGVTCNATVDLGQVTARSAGVSFTITAAAAPAVNPSCYSYFITN